MTDTGWLSYDVVDVFTDRPFAGNQLAVVHGADALSAGQCLALTQEFGYSESTFPSSTVTDGSEYATRIFTPGGEIPFAGHPTLGTAWVLRDRGLLTATDCVQVCGAGRIGVRLGEDEVELSAAPRDLVGPLPADLVADLLALVGLSPDDAAGDGWVAGCGLSFVYLPVAESAVARSVVAGPGFEALTARIEAVGPLADLHDSVEVYAVRGTGQHLDVHARVFVPGVGVPEDPATGSAAAGLGMVLVASGRLPEGGTYDVVQGVEMGRPSSLRGRVEAAGGRPTGCWVAGGVHHVASGRVRVPAQRSD